MEVLCSDSSARALAIVSKGLLVGSFMIIFITNELFGFSQLLTAEYLR
jgi:hypothetical protein